MFNVSLRLFDKSVKMSTFLYCLQLDDLGNDCAANFVELRDGESKTAPLLGKFCGDIIPPTVISSENQLWICYYTSKYSTYPNPFDNFAEFNATVKAIGKSFYLLF